MNIKPLNKYKNNFFLFLTLIIFIFEVFYIGYVTYQNADTVPIIYSINNDAAKGITVAYISDWLTDNKFYAYGNLYYRIAYTLNLINPFYNDINAIESADRFLHFILMMLSFSSLLLISFLISSILFFTYSYIILSTCILLLVFVTNPFWYEFILVVHPDLLLSFLTFVSIFFSTKYLIKKDNFNFYISSIFWGLALGTKLFSIFYLPAIFLIFVHDLKNKEYMKIFKYFGTIFITYFFIGFPQNFQISKTSAFLFYQSGYSLSPTLGSVLEWFSLFFSQTIYIFVVILILSLVSEKKVLLSRINIYLALSISLFPFLILLSRYITSPHSHYTFPIVSGFLAIYTIIVSQLPFSGKFRKFSLVVFFILLIVFSLSSKANMKTVLASQMNCREESREAYSVILKKQESNKIHSDPYIPFEYRKGNVINDWFPNIKKTLMSDITVLALSKNYYSRYLEKEISEYTKINSPTWKEQKEFYEIFANKNKVTDMNNNKWIKVYSNKCGVEVWQKE